MDYKKIYNQIIDRAKLLDRKKIKGDGNERHHIIPKCLGGSNKKDNFVLLTGREHFICHKLLTFIYPHNRDIFFSLFSMSTMLNNPKNKKKYKVGAREYERLNRELAQGQLGEKNHRFGKEPWNTGKEWSQEVKDSIGLKNKGKPGYWKGTKGLVKAWNKGRTGDKRSKESKDKQKETNSRKSFEICEWCGYTSNNRGGFRIHIKNCKSNPDYKPKIIICSYCGESGIDSVGMRSNHFNNCKMNTDFLSKEPSKIVSCPWCGVEGHEKGMLSNHFKNCPNNPDYKLEDHLHYCKYCDFSSTNKTIIIRFHNDNCKHLNK